MKYKGRENKGTKYKERFTWYNFVRIGFHIWRQFDDPYYAGFAAQVAYFFFMASVPTIVVLSQMLGIFNVSLGYVKSWLELHLDSRMSDMVSNVLNASSGGVSNLLLIVLAVWAASSLEFSLARLTSYTLTNGAYKFTFWKERLKAIPTALMTIMMLTFVIVVTMYSNVFLVEFINAHAGAAWRVLLSLRWPIIAAAFFATVLSNYYMIPRVRVPLVSILPGAIVASAGILLVTWIYSIYITHVSNTNILYGSLANIVGIMLWFYLIAWVFCIGMMFNKAWDDVLQRDRLTKEKMKKYVGSRFEDNEDYKKFLITDEGGEDPKDRSLSVKLSRKFLKEYTEEEDDKKVKYDRK